MLTHLRFLFACLSVLVLQNDPPPSDPPKPNDPPKADPPEVKFDDKQQEKVNALLAAERKKAEEDTAIRIKADAEAERTKAEAEAQRKKDEEAGKFDEVKASLEKDRDTASGERDQLKTERDTLLTLVKADVDGAWDTLPDEVKDAYDGDDDDPLAKKQHMTRMAKVTARLTADAETNPGHRGNPKNGKAATLDITQEAVRARARGGYRI